MNNYYFSVRSRLSSEKIFGCRNGRRIMNLSWYEWVLGLELYVGFVWWGDYRKDCLRVFNNFGGNKESLGLSCEEVNYGLYNWVYLVLFIVRNN